MAIFSVHTKDAPDQSMTLVREGFSLPAFILGPFWFAYRRAWLGMAAWMLGIAVIGGLAATFRLPDFAVSAAVFAFMVLMGLEACQFRRRSLTRRGYKVEDVVEASTRQEAEIRFLARRLSNASQDVRAPVASRGSPQPAENVGLFLSGA